MTRVILISAERLAELALGLLIQQAELVQDEGREISLADVAHDYLAVGDDDYTELSGVQLDYVVQVATLLAANVEKFSE